MEFDLSAITGSVNKYLNSISDTNKLLAQKKSETAFDPNLSGLFEKYLNKAMLDETQKNTAGISGEDAFRLNDTFGFPVDLIKEIAEEKGMSVDIAGYDKLWEIWGFRQQILIYMIRQIFHPQKMFRQSLNRIKQSASIHLFRSRNLILAV